MRNITLDQYGEMSPKSVVKANIQHTGEQHMAYKQHKIQYDPWRGSDKAMSTNSKFFNIDQFRVLFPHLLINE
jgi:hypothetical protein